MNADVRYYDNYHFGQCGWVCPKCGNIYSPFVQECLNCNNHITVDENIYKEAINALEKQLKELQINNLKNNTTEYKIWMNNEGGTNENKNS